MSTIQINDTNLFAYCGNDPINKADINGEAGMFVLANAVFGAVVGAAAQIAVNISKKDTAWHEGVLGAAIGGAAYNVVALVTKGNLAAASAVGSAVEATVNEISSYAGKKKALTRENILGSVSNVICRTAENTITSAAAGKVAGNIIKTNSGWFQPQKIISSFTGKYARKVFGQTAVQGLILAGYNTLKSYLGR